jgi:hypothetical protein
MRNIYHSVNAILIMACSAALALAQPAAKTTTAVPRLVKFGGTLTDAGGKPLSGVVGVTFALYQEPEGGAAIWMETQNVQASANGEYSVLLGATRNEGIPAEAFGAGQRWLGVQIQGTEVEPERPRVLLTSVPYSLKAVDAETLGGLPASAYALAGTIAGNGAAGTPLASARAAAVSDAVKPAAARPATVGGTGTAGTIPVWTSSTALGNSEILQSGGNVGIGRVSANAKFLSESTTGAALAGSTTSSTSPTAIGVQGQALATSGDTVGVVGISASPSGVAVEGQATAASGKTVGVQGTVTSTSGFGMTGTATAESGETYGVVGTVASSTGTAVMGQATATTGSNWGIYGSTASDAGVGVQGEATATSGAAVGVYGTTASDAGYAVWGDASAKSGTTIGVYGQAESETGSGVEGQATASSGVATGVYGKSVSSDGIGVEGNAISTSGATTGVAGTAASDEGVAIAGVATATSGTTYGIQGGATSPNGVGVYGIAISQSSIGKDMEGTSPSGVWGDTNSGTAAVLATSGDASAFAGYNSAGNVATLYVENQTTTPSAVVLATEGSGGYCDIFTNGNLLCSGSVGGHAILKNSSREVATYAMQSPENWFEDMGAGRLQNGAAVVPLDAEFAQTVNTGVDYHVFLTPKGDCKGLYVTNETSGGFEVRELGGGTSSIGFDYRIVARRRGYENIRMADVPSSALSRPHLKSRSGLRTARANVLTPRLAAKPADTARMPRAAKTAHAAKLPVHAAKPAISPVR